MTTNRLGDLEDPGAIIEVDFAVVRKGFDREQVRAFQHEVLAHVERLGSRIAQLEAALETREPVPLGELTDDELARALGDETARVLAAARQATVERLARAETDAQAIVDDANERAARIIADAEEADARKREAASDEAARIIADAEERWSTIDESVEAELDKARDEGRNLVDEARLVRQRILEDLSRRRQALRVQIEQLRAGRERLLTAYGHVRTTLEEATQELQLSMHEARVAAEAAGRRTIEEPLTSEELEEQLAAARMADLPLIAPSGALEVAAEAEPEVAPEVEAEAELEVEAAPEAEAEAEAEPEAEPEPEVEAEPEVEVGPESALEPTGSEPRAEGADVDDLFQAIRARRAARVNEAEELLARLDEESAGAPSVPIDTAAAGSSDVEAPEPAPSSDVTVPERVTAAEEDAVGADAVVRQLKRALADEQNEVLDHVRRSHAAVTVADLYGSERDHQARLIAAAGDLAPPELTRRVVEQVVGMIHRRVEACLAEEVGDEDEIITRVRAIYREVRGNRLSEVLEHPVG